MRCQFRKKVPVLRICCQFTMIYQLHKILHMFSSTKQILSIHVGIGFEVPDFAGENVPSGWQNIVTFSSIPPFTRYPALQVMLINSPKPICCFCGLITPLSTLLGALQAVSYYFYEIILSKKSF